MGEMKKWLGRCPFLGGTFFCAAVVLSGPGSPAAETDSFVPLQLQLETGRQQDGKFTLVGKQARQQLLVDGRDAAGNPRDLTRDSRFETAPPGIVTVDSIGVVRPVASGAAQITAVHPSGLSATTSVVVENAEHDLPVNFPTQVVPIFTKIGCNAGGCHGKSGGQNGFALSLLGFEPGEDYEYIVQEARGRRLSLAAPEQSLLLLKATGAVPHGGGKRFAVGEPAYEVLRRWIAAGAPPGDPGVKRVAAVDVLPAERIMPRGSQQQLVVIARYTDGTTEDVSELAKYKLSEPDMAEVNETGLVKAGARPGDVAVMVGYQSHVAVFRAILPLGALLENVPAPRNFIDELVVKKLRLLGLPPSTVCDDATFLRRVTIDMAGRLPTTEEAQEFLGDTASDKRDRAIDRLATSTDYADYFAGKWSAILRNQRTDETLRRGNYAFHRWIRQAIYENTPYDKFVTAILTAAGEVGSNPPVAWYRQVDELHEQAEDTAQLFLGLHIQCARCHHHPLEKWSQDDYYSFAAFFSRIGRKPGLEPSEVRIVHQIGPASATNPKTSASLRPAGLGAKPAELKPSDDPREALVAWMTAPENPFFARALVNRYWKHFFGRGLVDPEDDLRETNPATNPELLDALAAHFVKSGFDLQGLVRTICKSNTYQLSAEPNEFNKDDRQNFSRCYPRRLPAEVLLDAIDSLFGQPTKFAGVPLGTRAVQLPDSGFDSFFLTAFGRPQAVSACECERTGDASLVQSLHLTNSESLQRQLSADGGRAARLAADTQHNYDEKIRELYLTAFAREPQQPERERLASYLSATKPGDAAASRAAYEDAIWALVNTKEFLFNH
jgi:hypothetical protein